MGTALEELVTPERVLDEIEGFVDDPTKDSVVARAAVAAGMDIDELAELAALLIEKLLVESLDKQLDKLFASTDLDDKLQGLLDTIVAEGDLRSWLDRVVRDRVLGLADEQIDRWITEIAAVGDLRQVSSIETEEGRAASTSIPRSSARSQPRRWWSRRRANGLGPGNPLTWPISMT